MFNFNQIVSFLLISELGSFAAAALRLRISTTAVSKHIKLLEDEVKQVLFIRSTRKVTLTDFGEIFYQEAKELFEKAKSLDYLVKQHQLEPRGRVRIIASATFMPNYLLSKLNIFQQCYPHVELNIEFLETESMDLKDKFDVLMGFTHTPGLTDMLRSFKLFSIQNTLCAAPALLAHYGTPTQPEDLLKLPFINHILRQPPNVLYLRDDKKILTSSPKILLNNFALLTEACKNGLGALLTADSLVQDALKNGTLISLLPHLKYKHFDILLFYRNENLPAVRVFLEHCRASI